MRHLALPALLALVCAAPVVAEDLLGTPAPAPAAQPAPAAPADNKAQIKELEKKMKDIREAAAKGDPELAKLKTAADDAKKAYDAAVEAKLKDNVDYQAAKKQADELRPAKKEKKPEVHEQH